MAASRRPSTQATMRRLARSTANQSQTLRFLRPTNVHISSSSSASHSRRWAFFARRRGNAGLGCCAFFCQLGHRHARNARGPYDAALRVALDQQLFRLGVARGARRTRRVQIALVGARLAMVLGPPVAAAVLAHLVAGAPPA